MQSNQQHSNLVFTLTPYYGYCNSLNKLYEPAMIRAFRYAILLALLLISTMATQAVATAPSCVLLQSLAAAAKGQIARMHALVAAGADINASDAQGRTLLYIASEYGHAGLVKYLLDVGADLSIAAVDGTLPLEMAIAGRDQKTIIAIMRHITNLSNAVTADWQPLHYAAFSGNESVVNTLLDKFAADLHAAKGLVNTEANGVTPLYLAASQGNAGIAEKLLTYHAEPNFMLANGSTALIAAAEAGHTETVKVLLAAQARVNHCAHRGATALMVAAQNDHAEVVKLLLLARARMDVRLDDGYTALHLAAMTGGAAATAALLQYGANPNVSASENITPAYIAAKLGKHEVLEKLGVYHAGLNIADTRGLTPLHQAAKNGHPKAVNALLAAGAYIDATDLHGATPLHLAAKAGNLNVVKLLSMNGANINAIVSQTGETPLYYAASSGYAQIVKELLNYEATIDRMAGRLTPICIATKNGHSDVVRLLQANGADLNIGFCQVKPIRLSKIWYDDNG